MPDTVQQAARLTQQALTRIPRVREVTTAPARAGAPEGGWEKPVGVAIPARLRSLRMKLKKHSPKGKPRPRGFRVGGKFYTYRKPYTPGGLKASWLDKTTVRLSKNSILIENPLPYARFQDKGGWIKSFRAKPGKMLMYMFKGRVFHKTGGGVYVKKHKGFVKKAIQEWRERWNKDPIVKYALPDRVQWAPWRGVKVTG